MNEFFYDEKSSFTYNIIKILLFIFFYGYVNIFFSQPMSYTDWMLKRCFFYYQKIQVVLEIVWVLDK